MAKAAQPHPSSSVVDIVRGVRDREPALIDRMIRRIRADIPSYAREDLVGHDELRASLATNVDYVLSWLAGSAGPHLSAAEATGRRRAMQAVPLVDLIAAFRLGFTEIWNETVAVAGTQQGHSAEDLVALATVLFRAHDEYTTATVNGYRQEAQQMLRASERQRAVRIEAILAGTAVGGGLWEVAQAVNLPMSGLFLVVAAETRDLGHDPLPRIEPAIAVLDVTSVWRLEPGVSLGVLSIPNRSRLRPVLDLLNRHATGRVGVSPLFTQLTQAAWGRRLAQLAMDNNPDEVGVRQFRDSPLNFLLAAAPQAAMEASRAVLKDLLTLRPDDRDLLLKTFDAWVSAAGSARDAGAALFCHPNTVRLRLHRIERCTGRSLRNPADLAELVTAARAWSQLPHA